MASKKGSLMEISQIIFFIMLGTVFVFVMVLACFSQISFPGEAEDKCQEIGLELFDYETASMFTQSSITCINKTTNEITKIR